MLPLFALTIFLSAALLFMVQPMVAKMVLPLLGGSPAVWNTCMVFFQASLLAGYAYAHWSTKLLGLRRQAILHALITLSPLLLLPIAIRTSDPPAHGSPIPWLLLTLALAVGLPFFLASTTGPLMQRWFAATGHAAAKDPYFLYAASNAGSLIALLAYPLLLEPTTAIQQQSWLWTFGYIALALLILACAAVIIRKGAEMPKPQMVPGAAASEPSTPRHLDTSTPPLNTSTPRQLLRQRLFWILLAFIPSSLMLGATQYISTDVAAVPLLWVIPLAIYLLTFILAFSTRRLFSTDALSDTLAIVMAALTLVFLVRGEYRLPIWGLFGLHIAALFIAALFCHTRLAELRPPVHRLTEFYLLLALGGVLGGAFNGLLAPTIFTGVIEYPLVLVLACLVRLQTRKPYFSSQPAWFGALFDVCAGILIALIFFLLDDMVFRLGIRNVGIRLGIAVGIPAIAVYLLSPRRYAFAVGIAALLAISQLIQPTEGRLLHQERTFFGVYRIFRNDNILHPIHAYTTLVHGTTVHGAQYLDPEKAREPLTYYHRKGPLGDLFTTFADSPILDSLGLVGLGAGAIAAYGREGQTMVFHEIDPAVIRLAQDPEYFTYLRDSNADIRFDIGDGRLTMARLPDAVYGVIVLDAFSSDAIPVHLLTLEAFQLYLKKLQPRGIIAVHISNQYLYLEPVVARIADELNLAAIHRLDDPGKAEETRSMRSTSEWILLARAPQDLGPLASSPNWRPLRRKPNAPLWTDSYSNILSVFGGD
jgi:hypothetical protein